MTPTPRSPSRPTVQELRTPDQLAAAADEWALGDEWKTLSREASEANPFFEPWLALPATRHLTGDRDVRWLAVRDTRLLGIVPLERRPPSRSMPLPRWRLWRHPYCFLCTPLVRAGAEQIFWRAVLRWLGARAWLAAPLDLPWLSRGPVVEALERELRARGRPAVVARSWDRALLEPSGVSGSDYLARTMRKKKRKELRRQRARLADQGARGLEVTELAASPAPDEVAAFGRRFAALERAGWKGAEGTAMSSRTADRRFLDECLLGAAAAGALVALELVLDGQTIASKLVFRSQDTGFMFKIAYDERYARYSPGVLLEMDFVERVTGASDVARVDSCAAPDHPMIDHLWSERRTLCTLQAATGATSALYLRARPLVRRLRELRRPR